MKIFIQREILGRFESEFNDKDKGLVKTKKIQILDTLENGKHVLSEIKLDENQDITLLIPGTKIMLPVTYSTVQNKTYFKQFGELKINGK
ncbi:hypothetical protein [Arcobacter caeni]|uniref:Uncharacterized protein n=1 Tax=Arcobacter caeni TaxID=1912877 RepID=A0A363D2B0_9BACT|nr:hypothetical protein [Arcobacter caeni]PUE65431.1 hypothetical protein B0174_03655 [Arcobacter caeni]